MGKGVFFILILLLLLSQGTCHLIPSILESQITFLNK